ncbi:MAG: hypothetical protein ACRC0G_10465 [Fusobacteriaceae bacterium]
MNIADFRKKHHATFASAVPETALLNYAGLRTLLQLTKPKNNFEPIRIDDVVGVIINNRTQNKDFDLLEETDMVLTKPGFEKAVEMIYEDIRVLYQHASEDTFNKSSLGSDYAGDFYLGK